MNIFVTFIFHRFKRFLFLHTRPRDCVTTFATGAGDSDLCFLPELISGRLCSRDRYTYVPHLIAAGLGTSFEERCDNEIRSDSLDWQLHGRMNPRQCRKARWWQGGRAEGPGTYECFVNRLKFNATCPSCDSCKRSDLSFFFNL